MLTFFQPTAKCKKAKKKEQGFILVDTIVAIAIISIAFVSVFSTIQVIADSTARTQIVIQEKTEELYTSRFDLYSKIREDK